MPSQISNVMVSKPLMLENFVVMTYPNSPKHKTLKTSSNIFKLLKKFKQTLISKALTYRQSHPRIERNVASKPIQDCYKPRSHMSYLTTLQVVMISKPLMFENFVVAIHPNSPKCKTLKRSSNTFKLFKNFRQALIKKALT